MYNLEKEGKKIEEKLNVIGELIREKLIESGYQEKKVGSSTRRRTPMITKTINFTKDGFTTRIEIYKIEN